MTPGDRRLADVLGALQASIQEPDPDSLEQDPATWLARRGIHDADREALAALGGRRMLLYRRLVHKGLRGAIRVEIPRTAARLGDRFEAEARRFFEEEMPRSHYLRDVAFEFVEWASRRWVEDAGTPSYLVDLARHELSAFEVAAAPPEAPGQRAATGDALALDQGVQFDAAARVRRYAYPVHRLLADLHARDEPVARETWLLVYRDRGHDVRYLELTPLAAEIVTRLMAGEPLGAAVTRSAEARGEPLGPAIVEGTAKILADLAERGVVLGSTAPRAEEVR